MLTDKEKLTALMEKFAGGSQQGLAELIGVPRSSIATWMHRGSITARGREAILDAFPQVSPEWLKGTPPLDDDDDESGEEYNGPVTREMFNSMNTIRFDRRECIPFFGETRASCGVVSQFDNPELVTEHIHLPGVRAAAALPAEGISMEPTISDGDICLVGNEVYLRDVSPRRIYLIVTRDGQCMYKRVQDEGPRSPYVLVISENPDYTPHAERVEKNDILHLYPLKYVVHRVD